MTTAQDIITNAMRLFKIIDQTEPPSPTDLTNNVPILNDLLRAENADGACQYTMNLAKVTLPVGTLGEVYSFSVGVGQLVNVDAVAIKSIWMNDINLTVNRETRMAPKADVVRTTYPGIVTKWHQERQSDGSVRVYAWQPPRAPAQALIEYGGRLAPITAPDSPVALPPEGIHDATLLFGRRIYSSYGVVLAPTDVIVQDSERVNARWRDYARGTQWLRMVRS